jgi:ADP-dependent NAD(P)H-hydrate dehydratase / NAD(P)H-hydrate epimerase
LRELVDLSLHLSHSPESLAPGKTFLEMRLLRWRLLCKFLPMSIPVVTVSQMRQWEQTTWATGQTEAEVIRRVGLALARHALRMTSPGDGILVLAGKGNNGADARAAQPHLANRQVELCEIKDPAVDSTKLKHFLARHPALIIDGLFGIGLNRPLNADWLRVIETINAAKLKVLAVDVPSGLNAESGQPEGAAIKAAVTLTVGAPKSGMLLSSAVNFVGRLEVASDVGLIPCPSQSELMWTLPEDFRDFPPRREVATHKGTYGHAAIVAGSVGFHGAAVLASRGAQRAQPGLITTFTMPEAYVPVASQLQAVMVGQWKPGLDFEKKYSALLVGPGLAADEMPGTLREETSRLWRELRLPMIVDASALAWLPKGAVSCSEIRLITPHPGEAARILGTKAQEVQADRAGALRELSRNFGNCWVILKGHETLIGRATGTVYVNSSGNAHLAQGGSGDLLSGYLAGLLAQSALLDNPELTIRYAVWSHGAAADRLQESGKAWVIEDLADNLG